MLLVDDLAAGGTKNLRHTPRGLVTLLNNDLTKTNFTGQILNLDSALVKMYALFIFFRTVNLSNVSSQTSQRNNQIK